MAEMNNNAVLAAQVANNEIELLQAPGCKGKVITGIIGATATGGAFVGGLFLGKHLKKKEMNELEARLSAIEEYLSSADDFEETETDDVEKVEGVVEEKK